MTAAELLPYHLCLRLGVWHPDHLFEGLTWGQWEDWLQVDRSMDLSVHRDDINFAKLRSDIINLWKDANTPSVHPIDLLAHLHDDDRYPDITAEQMTAGIRQRLATSSGESVAEP